MIKTSLVCLLTICAFTATSQAQARYVGIPRAEMEYFASAQRASQWCWAASIQMILNHAKVDITQEQIVRRTYGVDPAGRLPDWTGDFRAITANLNNWSIDNRGKKYVVRAIVGIGPPAPTVLLEELSNGRAVMIGYATGPDSGHAAIVTGASYIPTPQGPAIQSLILRDPFPTRKNIRNGGRVEVPGADLAASIRHHWIIRVNH